MKLIQRCINENSRVALDQDEYLVRRNGLVERYEKAQGRIKDLEKEHTERMT